MSINYNIGLTPPPLTTPITGDQHDEFGVPFQHRGAALAAGTLEVAWAAWFNSLQTRVSALPAIQDTHANRANYPADTYKGLLYFETDRTVLYISKLISSTWTWVYLTGEYAAVQASLPSLGTDDAGFIVQVTDYAHRLKWSGSAWGWAPGDGGSGMLVLFEVDPTGAGWHLYDGSTVNYLKADGTLGSVTLPNLSTSPSFLEAAGSNSGPTPGSSSLTITGATAAASAVISSPVATGVDSGLGTTVQSGSGATVASHTHQHTIGSINDLGHLHNAGTLAISGSASPDSLSRRAWFRQ